MRLEDEIFCYIGKRIDKDNILPCEDDIYTEFRDFFDMDGYDTEVIERMVKAYVRCSDLTGVKIEWEGDLSGIGNRRITSYTKIPSKTA